MGMGREIMDAKKIGGVLIAMVLLVAIAGTANPETLAWMDVGLIGLFYVVRRRRISAAALRYGG